jgi:hypothetical protein
LAATGVKPLRVAFGGKVKPSLFEHTLDYKLEQHPLKPEVDKLDEQEQRIQKDIVALGKTIHGLDTRGRHQIRLDRMKSDMIVKERQYNVVRSKKYHLKQQMLRDILSDADVVRYSPGFILCQSLYLYLFFIDLHYVHHIRCCGIECHRFSCCLP